jgi:hypothetical protein
LAVVVRETGLISSKVYRDRQLHIPVQPR